MEGKTKAEGLRVCTGRGNLDPAADAVGRTWVPGSGPGHPGWVPGSELIGNNKVRK